MYLCVCMCDSTWGQEELVGWVTSSFLGFPPPVSGSDSSDKFLPLWSLLIPLYSP